MSDKRLAPYQITVQEKWPLWLVAKRRSFFLAFFIVMVFMCDCPCDLKRREHRSAQQGEQNCNIGECHGPHPLSALKHPGSGQLFKSQCLTRCFGAGKESAACVSNTVPFFLPLLALTLEYHKFWQFAIKTNSAERMRTSWQIRRPCLVLKSAGQGLYSFSTEKIEQNAEKSGCFLFSITRYVKI